jgi:hypothetical protein
MYHTLQHSEGFSFGGEDHGLHGCKAIARGRVREGNDVKLVNSKYMHLGLQAAPTARVSLQAKGSCAAWIRLEAKGVTWAAPGYNPSGSGMQAAPSFHAICSC